MQTPDPATPPPSRHADHADAHPLRALMVKGSVSGVLMGLANLVPGVSAGAVLLATGIFKAFVTAIADLATFKFRLKPIVLLGFLGIGWVAAVLLGAGPVKQLVVEHRWVMYSLFIGLTLGGVPLVWEHADRRSSSLWIASAVGFLVMAALGLAQMLGLFGDQTGRQTDIWLLVLGGLLAAGATVLPGGSGTFVLLLMGLYVPILGAVSAFKDALVGADVSAGLTQARILVPFALGMGLGLVSVSVLMKWTLARFPQATAGTLLGLLVGSVVGLWPFQEGVQPKVGDVVKGQPLTPESLAALKPEDWPVAVFTPTLYQVVSAAALIAIALGLTVFLTRLERRLNPSEDTAL